MTQPRPDRLVSTNAPATTRLPDYPTTPLMLCTPTTALLSVKGRFRYAARHHRLSGRHGELLRADRVAGRPLPANYPGASAHHPPPPHGQAREVAYAPSPRSAWRTPPRIRGHSNGRPLRPPPPPCPHPQPALPGARSRWSRDPAAPDPELSQLPEHRAWWAPRQRRHGIASFRTATQGRGVRPRSLRECDDPRQLASLWRGAGTVATIIVL